jgi:hypothetical protein
MQVIPADDGAGHGNAAHQGMRIMPDYRMYSLDPYGRIGFAEDIKADSDDEAIRLARDVKPDPARGEIWQGRRLVAVVNNREWELDPV